MPWPMDTEMFTYLLNMGKILTGLYTFLATSHQTCINREMRFYFLFSYGLTWQWLPGFSLSTSRSNFQRKCLNAHNTVLSLTKKGNVSLNIFRSVLEDILHEDSSLLFLTFFLILCLLEQKKKFVARDNQVKCRGREV